MREPLPLHIIKYPADIETRYQQMSLLQKAFVRKALKELPRAARAEAAISYDRGFRSCFGAFNERRFEGHGVDILYSIRGSEIRVWAFEFHLPTDPDPHATTTFAAGRSTVFADGERVFENVIVLAIATKRLRDNKDIFSKPDILLRSQIEFYLAETIRSIIELVKLVMIYQKSSDEILSSIDISLKNWKYIGIGYYEYVIGDSTLLDDICRDARVDASCIIERREEFEFSILDIGYPDVPFPVNPLDTARWPDCVEFDDDDKADALGGIRSWEVRPRAVSRSATEERCRFVDMAKAKFDGNDMRH